jgi:cell division protein FtsI/penicillin-binding protein 2
MNTNMRVTIRHLTNAFVLLLLVLSGVAAYVQIGNLPFLQGPQLASGTFDPRACLSPDTQPIRGTIFDRNGVKLAWTTRDDTAPCGFRRHYLDPSLSPLIGYFSYKRGSAHAPGTDGLEQTYNDVLSGATTTSTIQGAVNKLLHKQQRGADIYLAIDYKVQQKAEKVFNASALTGGVCQTNPNPPGSLIVEDPHTGELLAMVSHPNYDANRVDDDTYWAQLNADTANSPLLNHATLSRYDPGSTFKTLTLMAALDTGTYSLSDQFDEATARQYVVNGETINWDDYTAGVWNGIVSFPLTLQDAYAYSDNVVYARVAVKTGADAWLSYVRKFGIATPFTDVAPLPFDGLSERTRELYQSSAYNAYTNGQKTEFNDNLLAESGFGQGQLFIAPLTMAEITSTIAADGNLYVPHAVREIKLADGSLGQLPYDYSVPWTGGPVIHPETAQHLRAAMWSVVNNGTAYWGLTNGSGVHLRDTGTFEGGKTGTAQLSQGDPHTWWISLAPDDQAPGGSAAKYVVVLNKERSGEGACQAFVADDVYKYLLGLS